MATQQTNVEAIKNKYENVDALKADANFAKLDTAAQQQAIAAFNPAPVVNKPAGFVGGDPGLVEQPVGNTPIKQENLGTTVIKNDLPNTQTEQPGIVQQNTKNKTGTMDLLPVSEYQDTSSDRMNKIVSNLNQYRQNAPQFLTNQQTFRDNFNYEGRIDQQKKTLDDWYTGYQKGLSLSNTNTEELVTNYTDGKINDNDLEQLKLNNPNKYNEVMDLYKKKTTLSNYKDELYGKSEDTAKKDDFLTVDNTKTGSLFDEYRKSLNSEEVKLLETDMANKNTEIEQLKLELLKTEDDIKKQYEGTGASTSKIARIVADQQSDIQNKLTKLGIDYNNSVNKYNSIANKAKDIMELGLKEQESERAARNQKMSELGFYYQYDPQGMTEMAETKFNIDNPDINSENPTTAKRALNNELAKYYEQYGDIILRPQSQALNDIISEAKTQGISLSQALRNNFVTPLQEKDLYKAKLQKGLGLDFDEYTLTKDQDGNWKMNDKVVSSGGVFDWDTGNVTSRGFKDGNVSDKGIDYDVSIGDKIPTPYSGTITEVGKRSDGTVYTNVTTDDGTLIQFNHLDGSTLNQFKAGTKVNAGDIIGIGGNTGKVIPGPGGDGSHIDVRVKQKDGTYLTGKDADAYLRGGTGGSKGPSAVQQERFKDGKIDPKGKTGLTQAQYNAVAAWNQKNQGSGEYDKAFSLLSFSTQAKADAEKNNLDSLAKSGDANAIKSKLVNLAVNNIEGAESKKDYQSTNQMIGTLGKIKTLLDQAKELGVPTGYLSGKYEDIANKFGKSTDPRIAKLGTTLRDQLDSLRRGRSGAALTEFEEQFYNSIFPSEGKKYNLNVANIEGLMASRNMIMQTYLENAYTPEIAQQILGMGVTQQEKDNGPIIKANSYSQGVGSVNDSTSFLDNIF